MIPKTPVEKLRIIFRNALRRGYVRNASLDPVGSAGVHVILEAAEVVIVRIDSRFGGCYWLSDRRVLREAEDRIRELFPYDALRSAHWMFRDLRERMSKMQSSYEVTTLKSTFFDRIEIDLELGTTVMEGLGSAYPPTLSFLCWLVRRPPT